MVHRGRVDVIRASDRERAWFLCCCIYEMLGCGSWWIGAAFCSVLLFLNPCDFYHMPCVCRWGYLSGRFRERKRRLSDSQGLAVNFGRNPNGWRDRQVLWFFLPFSCASLTCRAVFVGSPLSFILEGSVPSPCLPVARTQGWGLCI